MLTNIGRQLGWLHSVLGSPLPPAYQALVNLTPLNGSKSQAKQLIGDTRVSEAGIRFVLGGRG